MTVLVITISMHPTFDTEQAVHVTATVEKPRQPHFDCKSLKCKPTIRVRMLDRRIWRIIPEGGGSEETALARAENA